MRGNCMKHLSICLVLVLLLTVGLAGCAKETDGTETLDPNESLTETVEDLTVTGVPVTDKDELNELQRYLNIFYFNPAFSYNTVKELDQNTMLTFSMFYAAKYQKEACTFDDIYVSVPETLVNEIIKEFFDRELTEFVPEESIQISLAEGVYTMKNSPYGDMTFCDVDSVLRSEESGNYLVHGNIGYADDLESGIWYTGEVTASFTKIENRFVMRSYETTMLPVPSKDETAGLGDPVDKGEAFNTELLSFIETFYDNKAFASTGIGAVTPSQMREFAIYEILNNRTSSVTEDDGFYSIPKDEVSAVIEEFFGVASFDSHVNTGLAVFTKDSYRISKEVEKTVPGSRSIALKEVYDMGDDTYLVYLNMMAGDAGKGEDTVLKGVLRTVVEETDHGFILMEYATQAGDLDEVGSVVPTTQEDEIALFMETIFFSPAFGLVNASEIDDARAEYFAVDYLMANPTDLCTVNYSEGYTDIPESEVDRVVNLFFNKTLSSHGLENQAYTWEAEVYRAPFIGRPSLFLFKIDEIKNVSGQKFEVTASSYEPDYEDPSSDGTKVGEITAVLEKTDQRWVLQSYVGKSVTPPAVTE